MGEKSKKRGEFGEKITKNLMEIIGWSNPLLNRDIPCIKGGEHAISTRNRESHGVDFINTYQCPLFANTQQFVLVSSKFTDSYDSNPVPKFKLYLKELAHAIDCFKNSELRSGLKDTSFGMEYKHAGVIFWLDNKSNYHDVIDRLTDFKMEDDGNFESIYLVDNRRANFLFDSIDFAKKNFKNAILDFFHPNTGYNLTIKGKITSSKLLPVQYINSSILPIKITTKAKDEYLVINCIDNFEGDYLRRLIAMSLSFSEGWGQRIYILFPFFNPDEHQESVENIKLEFRDKRFIDKVTVSSYKPNLRNV